MLSLWFHIFCFKKKASNKSLFSHSLYTQHTPLNSPGIYIRTLIPDGPAAADGRLCIGDRILAVNGTSLIGADYQRSVLYMHHQLADNVCNQSVNVTFSPGMILCNINVFFNPDIWIPLCLSLTVLWIWFVWGEDGSGFLSPNQILKYQRRSVPLPAEREALPRRNMRRTAIPPFRDWRTSTL